MRNKIKSYLSDLFFPSQNCSFCGKLYQTNNYPMYIRDNELSKAIFQLPKICSSCKEQLTLPDAPYCYSCHKPLKDILYNNNDNLCEECEMNNKEKNFVFNRSVLLYTTFIKDLLALYKYRGKMSLATDLSHLMKLTYDFYFNNIEIDLLTYVPLHKNRSNERGFNQAEQLAKELYRLSGVEIIDSLIKLKDTSKLSMTFKEERIEKVKGAFIIKEEASKKINGKSVLLVDDIYTTGVTINECSKILKNAGAKKIYSLTLARAF